MFSSFVHLMLLSDNIFYVQGALLCLDLMWMFSSFVMQYSQRSDNDTKIILISTSQCSYCWKVDKCIHTFAKQMRAA